MRGKEILIAGLSVVLTAMLATASDMFDVQLKNVSTSASAGSAVTNRGGLSGHIDMIVLDVTDANGATYIVSNTTTTSTPSVIGVYYNRGSTYGPSTNTYQTGDGVYKLWYTNGVTYISTNVGYTTKAWTNSAGSLTGTYFKNSTSISGVVVVAASTPDIDVDIVTVPDKGAGPQRTVFSKDDITADGSWNVRDIADTVLGVEISNQPVLVPVDGCTLKITAYDANHTGITVRAFIYLTD